MNLTEIIKNWPQSEDDALVGTKYANKEETYHKEVDVDSRTIVEWKEVTGEQALLDDRTTNAAKCEVQAALIRELVAKLENIVQHEKYMPDNNHDANVMASMATEAITTAQAWIDKQEGK